MSRFLIVSAAIVALALTAIGKSSEDFPSGIGYNYNSDQPADYNAYKTDEIAKRKADSVTQSEDNFKSKNDAADARDDARYKLEQRQADTEEKMTYWTRFGSVTAGISIVFLILTLGAMVYQNRKLAETNRIMQKTRCRYRLVVR